QRRLQRPRRPRHQRLRLGPALLLRTQDVRRHRGPEHARRDRPFLGLLTRRDPPLAWACQSRAIARIMAAMGRSGLRARSRTGAGGAADCATCNCAALRQAARHVTRLYDDALAPLGLGANQYSILSTLEGVGASAI